MAVSDDRYDISRRRLLVHRATDLLPPAWRDRAAEWLLRRRDAPGPASEHVMQFVLSAAKRPNGEGSHAKIAKGADLFYERQYRQYLNATMGAFAMTATQVLVGTGGAMRGRLWGRRRKTYAVMLEETEGGPPLLVLDRETVAVPMPIPLLDAGEKARAEIELWLEGERPMPPPHRALAVGQEVLCAESGVYARELSFDGAILEVVDAVLQSKRLALLALHPRDPDAMGLHITLFGVEVVSADRLELEYGLDAATLETYRDAARAKGRMPAFCVGGTEETFTQCSQNLFVKRPLAPGVAPKRAVWPDAWDPRHRLERLFGTQFEMIQVTVSALGLPGASPRNGDRGKLAFVARQGARPVILIPYYPGNFVHGHAAKLWSNPYASLVISDDHTTLTRVTISGPSRIMSHKDVARRFPEAAAKALGDSQAETAVIPDYWFLQEVAELVQQHEPLAAQVLDPQRPSCSISAGGQAKHGKKPAYFAADTLPPYERDLQHERESKGRPKCSSGLAYRDWLGTVGAALEARDKHLAAVLLASLQKDLAAASFVEEAEWPDLRLRGRLVDAARLRPEPPPRPGFEP